MDHEWVINEWMNDGGDDVAEVLEVPKEEHEGEHFF